MGVTNNRPVGGCLTAHWQSWQKIAKDPWVVTVLRGGYQIPFKGELPPLSPNPIPFRSYHPSSPQYQALSEEIKLMLKKEAIEEAPLPLTSGYYARMFVVPKGDKGDEWRPIIDLSRLNKYILLTPFKMETPRTVLQSIRKGDQMISLDLQDAYFQVPIHPHSSRYLRFVWEGKTYQFRALCFGLSTAPQIFTRICVVIGAHLHHQGIRLLRYLDDWLLLAPSREICIQHRNILLDLCLFLGLRINLKKSSLCPAPVIIYLGMKINTITFLASPKEKRITKFISLAKDFLRIPQSLKNWEVLLGIMASLIDLVHGSQLRMRPFQFNLRLAKAQGLSNWDLLPLPPSCRSALLWWLKEGRLSQGIPISLSPPEISMETDASTIGWGCRIESHLSQGLWSQQERQLHINILELRAIYNAIFQNKHLLQGKVVALYGDNTTALAYIKHWGGTKSPDCYLEACNVLLLAESLQILLIPRFIQGTDNVIADALSRPHQSQTMEWSLHPLICQNLWSLWGTPQIDAFATRFNHKIKNYFSPVPDSQALAIDAFLQPWHNLFLYIFPPTKTLRKVLRKIRESLNVQVILIAPFWPQQAWFPDLLDLLTEEPRSLPPWGDLLTTTLDQKECLRVNTLRLHAWRLSSISSEREIFQKKLPQFSPLAIENQQINCITHIGKNSVIGVLRGRYILSHPLFPSS